MFVKKSIAMFGLVVPPSAMALRSQFHARDPSNLQNWNTLAGLAGGTSLVPRQEGECPIGYIECGTGCMPTIGVCCDGIK